MGDQTDMVDVVVTMVVTVVVGRMGTIVGISTTALRIFRKCATGEISRFRKFKTPS